MLRSKLGLGQLLKTIFVKNTKNKLFLDIKLANKQFATKFNNFVKNIEKEKIKICGMNWKTISEICQESKLEAYYTIRNAKSWEKFKKTLPFLEKPRGFSIHHSFIDESLIFEIKEIAKNIQIWAWTVNSKSEFARLEKLKVDGIITDKWK